MRLMEWEVYKMYSSSPNYEIDQRERRQLGKHLNMEVKECAKFFKE
ncbi:hypothetical protein [Sideroxydans sp. CL21]|nr:hypothetical protein [Sideroxydans sp. CL21]